MSDIVPALYLRKSKTGATPVSRDQAVFPLALEAGGEGFEQVVGEGGEEVEEEVSHHGSSPPV
jgi:hypothetical protein